MLELKRWAAKVRHPDLIAVRDFKRDPNDSVPVNYYVYQTNVGSIMFFRNSTGHIRDNKALTGVWVDDADIIFLLEKDLPFVIPVWYHSLFTRLDLNPRLCRSLCGYVTCLFSKLY